MFGNKLSSLSIITASLILLYSPFTHAGKTQHRQHGSHEHGSAQLNIAIEGQRLYLELSSPAANIVGFEHKPHNDKQRQTLKKAIKILNQTSLLFTPSASAQCKSNKIEVDVDTLQDEHDKKDSHHHHSGHADFSAHYVFVCQKPSKLTTLQLLLFKPFPGIEKLQVQLLTETGQSAITATAQKATIKLK
ncbi:MAG: DUF2796 domain-containing protein [Gammaproteobacteria bacterium]|nr:DUF2796 domain-containing protein [Gammaproteobacteria bacterium]